MAKLIKCKICGDTEFTEVGELLQCRSCRHKTPKPKDNAELLERANNLRFETKSFDDAANLYEEIIRITPDEAEAYWGRVLCRYGIEHVKDSDGRYLPTCHRTLEGSILDDGDYKMAVMKAERGMSEYYMTEAQTIDEYQKKIKLIAAKEEPYDVFISFKATDEYGRPTEDSLLAQELYYYLTKNLGLKVFFSNITLKDKAGQEYEPIIYAALSSATVMVLVGTKPEYVNATWVKNEWSRYTKMVAEARAQNKSKYIVTALKDMRPEQLPSSLAAYQAVNLGELGAKEKLCSNIDSLIGDLRVSAQKSAATAAHSFNANDMLSAEAANLCNLGYQQLAVSDFSKADEYFQKAIEKKSDTALAHWGLLLVGHEASNDEALADMRLDIKAEPRYKMAMEYANAEERMRFERIDSLIEASFAKEVQAYCDRGFEALKDNDFDGAYELFEKAIEIKPDYSRAHWGMMLSVEEFPSEEALDDFIGHLDGSTYFQAAMQCASPEEQARYNRVLDKIRENNQTKAAEYLANADEDLASDQGSLHNCAQESITLAINLKKGDVPAKYYWAWLRTFLGAVDDDMLAQEVAYPMKDDIYYKRAIERATPAEAAHYERIAERCHRLYDCRNTGFRHCIRLHPDGTHISFDHKESRRKTFIKDIEGEVAMSVTNPQYFSGLDVLDKYMVRYVANIIPDICEEVEGENVFSRHKYLKRDTVSIYLHDAGKWSSLVKNDIVEKLGFSQEKADEIIRQAPCYIAHDVPIDAAGDVRWAIHKHNGLTYLHAEPLDDIIRDYKEPAVNPNETVSFYFVAGRYGNEKETRNILIKKLGIAKPLAKEIAKVTCEHSFANTPTCIAANIPLSQANELLKLCHDKNCEGEIRWK